MSKGQRSRLQRDITGASINSAGDARFRSNFQRLWTRDTWCTTNVHGQRVTASRNLL